MVQTEAISLDEVRGHKKQDFLKEGRFKLSHERLVIFYSENKI